MASMPEPRPEKVEDLERKLASQERLQEIANRIHSARNLNEIFLQVKDDILKYFDAERITIYGVDARNNQIYSKYKEGKEILEIRLPIDGHSLAGFVAMSKKPVNIADAYDQGELDRKLPVLHFDRSWDEKTGFKTHQVLAVPIICKRAGKAVFGGVVQLMNRRSGVAFGAEDQLNLERLAEALGIAFLNQQKMIHRTPTKFDLLLDHGLVTEEDLNEAIGKAKTQRVEPETILVTEYKVAREEVARSLGSFYGCGYLVFDEKIPLDPALLRGVRLDYLLKRFWVPIARIAGKPVVLVDDPRDLTKIDEIRAHQQLRNCEMRVALREDILRFVRTHMGVKEAQAAEATAAASQAAAQQPLGAPMASVDEILSSLKGEDGTIVEDEDTSLPMEVTEGDSNVVRLANQIVRDAFRMRASDIHVEPYGKRDMVIRIRIDGVCVNYLNVPASYSRALVSRYKIMSSLDIAERRKPQDGKIKFRLEDREIELRVATIPTAGGNEDVVMRILAASEPLPLPKIGMSQRNFQEFVSMIGKPYGIVLVVGPTGSGKTTTLHSALGYINTPERKIWTAEDPVEITQYGLRQVQVHSKIGFTFAAAMRSFLRADPDVIMVGEMRDQETAETGIEASLTGHLVFSTLHTNSAPETVTRLLEMGMDPFNFADSLLGVLAQRLVRTLCPKCKAPYMPEEREFEEISSAYGKDAFSVQMGVSYSKDFRLYRGSGCDYCNNTGYRGRMGIHELLVGTDRIKEVIQRRGRVEELRQLAVQDGMTTLLQDGVAKALQGHTDFKQVRAVCIR
jgi:type II secretory ATPase GspE/PulE/Tfp pilus assembly ATPase PilB-like protein